MSVTNLTSRLIWVSISAPPVVFGVVLKFYRRRRAAGIIPQARLFSANRALDQVRWR